MVLSTNFCPPKKGSKNLLLQGNSAKMNEYWKTIIDIYRYFMWTNFSLNNIIKEIIINTFELKPNFRLQTFVRQYIPLD
jgi:hypothetical protein